MCKQLLYPVLRYHICPLALPLLLHKLSLHLLWTFLKDKHRTRSEYIQWLNKMPRGSFSLSRDTRMQRQLKPGDKCLSFINSEFDSQQLYFLFLSPARFTSLLIYRYTHAVFFTTVYFPDQTALMLPYAQFCWLFRDRSLNIFQFSLTSIWVLLIYICILKFLLKEQPSDTLLQRISFAFLSTRITAKFSSFNKTIPYCSWTEETWSATE